MRIKRETVYLDKRHLDVATEFALKRQGSSSLYRLRGGFKQSDIITGALGEMAVYKLLKLRGIKLNKPDFNIYTSERKSFKADLLTDCGALLHVKSQSLESAEKYGKSYLLQKSDSVLKRPGVNDYLVPTLVDLENLRVDIFGVIPVKTIVGKGLVNEPRVSWFKRSKVAIYLQDLKTLTAKQRWRLL